MRFSKKIRGCSFFIVCSLIIILVLKLLSNYEVIQDYLGFPLLGSILVIFLIFVVIFNLINKSSKVILPNKSNRLWIDKPEKTSFLYRNYYVPILPIGLGVYVLIKESSISSQIFGIVACLIGIYSFIIIYIEQYKSEYCFDSKGVYIKRLNFVLLERADFIRFSDILEVHVIEGYFEQKKGLGTLNIYTKEEDNEGRSVCYKLIGIKKPYEVSKQIIKNIDRI